MCIVSCHGGDTGFVKLHSKQSMSSLKTEISNCLDLPILLSKLTHRLEQQPDLVFSPDTEKDIEYLLEVCGRYDCIVVNVYAKVYLASSSRICTDARPKWDFFSSFKVSWQWSYFSFLFVFYVHILGYLSNLDYEFVLCYVNFVHLLNYYFSA